MGHEATKAANRRVNEPIFAESYIVGHGIDIGAGNDQLQNFDGLSRHKDKFPKMLSCKNWDTPDGDAQLMQSVADSTYDFVHSAHTYEHMHNPIEALKNWIRILKPGGHLIVTIPDEDLYEQGIFPSRFNGDHKVTFTIYKNKSWSPVSYNIIDILSSISNIKIKKIQLQEHHYDYSLNGKDQTGGPAECAIEFVVQKVK